MIHSYATPSSLLGYAAAHATRTPVLLRTESEHIRPRSRLRRATRQGVVRILTRLTAGFLVIGSANRDFYLSVGVSEDRLFNTPYAVDNEFFDQTRATVMPRRAQIRAEMGFPEDLPVIVFSAKLIDRKRPLDIVEAVARLAGEGTAVGLLIIGEGTLRDDIESMVRTRQLPYVHLTGFVNQTGLSRYYAAGDVFVLPAEFDTWGLVVNEAMLFRMPAIVTDMVGAGRDLVEDGVTGYVYKVGDIDALADRLKRLVRNGQCRTEMGEAARAKVVAWSFDEDVAGILNALQWLAHKPSTLRAG